MFGLKFMLLWPGGQTSLTVRVRVRRVLRNDKVVEVGFRGVGRGSGIVGRSREMHDRVGGVGPGVGSILGVGSEVDVRRRPEVLLEVGRTSLVLFQEVGRVVLTEVI